MSYHLRNSVIRSPAGKIKFRRFNAGGHDHYHIGVWLEAENDRQLDHVEFVEYELHSTFKNRVRRSAKRSNNFSVTFWSWGTFKVRATAHLVGGETVTVEHQLQFDLPAEDDQYVEVTGGE